MRGMHSASLMRIAWAMVMSYRCASRDFVKSRQKTVLLLGFALMPLASIPEALFSPLLMLGDPGVGPLGRSLGLTIVFFLWNAWMASQQDFVPSIHDMDVIKVAMSSPAIAFAVALRYCILSWPAFLLVASLSLLHDGSDRIQAARVALCAVVVSSCAVTEWRESRPGRRRFLKLTRVSSGYVLLRHALSSVASWADPRVPSLHVYSLVAVIFTYVVLSRLPSSSGTVVTSLIGSLSALLPLRALLDLASQRTMEACPMLVACPGYRIVERYRVCFATAVLFVACMTACAVGQGWGGPVGNGAMNTATSVSLLFLGFVSCRMAEVPRGTESSVLCAFGMAGIIMECI